MDNCTKCKRDIADKAEVRYFNSRKVCEGCFDTLLVQEDEEPIADRLVTVTNGK